MISGTRSGGRSSSSAAAQQTARQFPPGGSHEYPVRTEDDLLTVRHAVRAASQELGFSLVDQTRVVTAASELARNALIHGGGGALFIEPVREITGTGLRLVVKDDGPGIKDVEGALTDGLHHRGGPGTRAGRRAASHAQLRGAHRAGRRDDDHCRAVARPMTSEAWDRPVTVETRIDHYSAVHLAATRARSLGTRCGLGGSLPDQAAAVASELASNLDKYAREGSVYLQALPLGEGLEILAVDRGPGMADPRRCLTDGYTTAGSLGTGLGAVQRIATDFRINSTVPDGTVAAARITGGQHRPLPSGAGMVCLPAAGEDVCGDSAAIHENGHIRTALVIDGLGHGEAAAHAAGRGLRVFHDHCDDPLEQIMQRMHHALRHTRGAAVGLVRIAPGTADFCAVGNIRLCVLSPQRPHRQLDGRPGIVGWNLPTVQTRTATVAADETTVLYSDGIEARWARQPSAYFLGLPAEVLPVALGHRHRRLRDDATAVSLAGVA